MRSGACIAQAKHKSARNAKSNAASTSRGRVAPKANGAWKNRHVRCRSQAGQEEQLKFVNLPGGVPAGLQWADGSWYGSLAKVGYRGDRPSIWVVSGLSDLNLNDESYDAVLENVSNGIMLDSFVVGELAVAVDGTNPVDSLASWDMLAMSTRFEDAITKLSRHQHRVYTTYTNQLESDADEDYFDNIV
eukprot:jgi/Pico_ML_1/55036/g792.t1